MKNRNELKEAKQLQEKIEKAHIACLKDNSLAERFDLSSDEIKKALQNVEIISVSPIHDNWHWGSYQQDIIFKPRDFDQTFMVAKFVRESNLCRYYEGKEEEFKERFNQYSIYGVPKGNKIKTICALDMPRFLKLYNQFEEEINAANKGKLFNRIKNVLSR